jgi:hypothetical protein
VRSVRQGAVRYWIEVIACACAPLVAHCHLGLGKLYRHTGKHEQAREHLATATTMYREMGMTFWLEKAEAEVRELG